MRILVSAGEASGDMYAARMVRALHKHYESASYFGCTGPRVKEASVETVVDSAKLSVVGLAEVAGHLPGIYREYRKLVHLLREDPPDAALLTDSPDFHLRLACVLPRCPAGLGVASGQSAADPRTCAQIILPVSLRGGVVPLARRGCNLYRPPASDSGETHLDEGCFLRKA